MRPGKKQIHFRINEGDYEKLIPLFKENRGIGRYFMLVSNLYSDKTTSLKIEMRKTLTELYKKYNADLSHIGNNLNQGMKHCNELAKIGKLTKVDFDEQIDTIMQLKKLITDLQSELFDITKTITKL